MRPTAAEFTEWLFIDVARRLDASRKGPRRGQRRFRAGRPMLIYSEKVLDRNAQADVWGICYQNNDTRVRGDDLTYRLTLAVLAYKQETSSIQRACKSLVCHARVKRLAGFKGRANDSETLRARVYGYIRRMIVKGIYLENDLRLMQEQWRHLHIDEMRGDRWHQEVLFELRRRVASLVELMRLATNSEERHPLKEIWVQQVLHLAMELHDSGDYEEAGTWYGVVIDDGGELKSEVMLKWLTDQKARCERRQGRSHPLVLMGAEVERVQDCEA